jgi:hypothetical protein
MLHASLNCPFLIATSVFPNVYLDYLFHVCVFLYSQFIFQLILDFGENNTFNTNIKKILMHIFVILNVYFHLISNELIPSICVLICDIVMVICSS